jgi:hypothetical protein
MRGKAFASLSISQGVAGTRPDDSGKTVTTPAPFVAPFVEFSLLSTPEGAGP